MKILRGMVIPYARAEKLVVKASVVAADICIFTTRCNICLPIPVWSRATQVESCQMSYA